MIEPDPGGDDMTSPMTSPMTSGVPRLIPYPRRIRIDQGGWTLSINARGRFDLAGTEAASDQCALDQLRRTIRERAGSSAPGSPGLGPSPPTPLRFKPSASRNDRDESYRLTIGERGITIQAATSGARYYAIQTLRQLIMHYGLRLPRLEIDDAPDFARRGFMHDVSRGKVPRLKTLFQLVEWLGFLKYNQLQLYVEHTFAFKNHPLLGRGHSPLTARDLRALDAHCRRHHVELVPNLQSFGHAQGILKHRRYRDLAESDHLGGWTLSPTQPGTYRLLEEMYEEFLPNFTNSSDFNVGCDETWDLGRGKSSALAAKIGLGRVYLGHILKVRKLAGRFGRRMMIWGDILANHPELLPELPRDVILLNWGYEAHGEERRYGRRLRPARDSGLEHWVCPGTSAWNSLFFRMTNARANLRRFAKAGRQSGASGYLVTDWGDNGHYNFLSYSLWPLAYGADCAWRVQPDPVAEADFDSRMALLLLGDRAGEWIEPMRILGDLYLAFGVRIPNNSAERWLLTGKPDPEVRSWGVSPQLAQYNRITRPGLKTALKLAERAEALLERLSPPDRDFQTIRDEWLLGARLAGHACRAALWRGREIGSARKLRKEIERLASDFEAAWLLRNRKSDLDDNLLELRRVALAYSTRDRKPVKF